MLVRILMTPIPLRARLMALIVTLVTTIVAALSVLFLNEILESWATDVLERSELAAQQVENFMLPRVTEQAEGVAGKPHDLASVKRRWQEIVGQGPGVDGLLVVTLTN